MKAVRMYRHGGPDVLSRRPDAPILRRHEIAALERSSHDSHELRNSGIGES